MKKITMRIEASFHQYQTWGESSKVTKTCHHLLAAHKAQPLKEPQVVLELGEVGSQGVPRLGRVEFTRQMQVQVRICWSEFNTETMAVIPPALTLKPHNSVLPCMYLVAPKPLSLCQRSR